MKSLIVYVSLALFFLSGFKAQSFEKAESPADTEQVRTFPDSQKSANIKKKKDPGVVSHKIKQVFKDFLDILEKKSIVSSEYKKAVHFLENSLYSQASFESLKILAEVYKDKKDFQNQIKVLNILTVNYADKAEAFYLLGRAYQNLYYSGEEEDRPKNKAKAIEKLNQALKLDIKFVPAYESLIALLKRKVIETDQEAHTKDSLAVVVDMLKYVKNKKYYIDLCMAYYDNNFLKQSRKACAKSIKENPDDPIAPLILALISTNKKETGKKLVKLAKNFKTSFFVQYNTALYFRENDPSLAGIYFDSAYILKPDHLTLNKIMAKFFFDNKQEEKSYKHFLSICHLTDGASLRDFRIAKRTLLGRKLVDLAQKFQQGIDKCFSEANEKKKKQQKKTKPLS